MWDLAQARFEDDRMAIIHHVARVYTVNTDQVDGEQFYVDVSGAFTTSRPGLMRTDTLWKMLGRIHVLQSAQPGTRVMILTSNLPRHNSEGDKALRAVGPASVFDAIEIFDPAGLERLQAYGTNGAAQPLPGFWTEKDVAGLS